MVYQHDPFCTCIQNISARKISYQGAFTIDYGHGTAASEGALYLAHGVFWSAVVELAVHDILCADAQVNQAHSSKRMMGRADNHNSLLFCRRQSACRDQ